MLKKIVIGILLSGVAAVLVFGAIQRTNAKVGGETLLSEQSGQGGQGGARQGWASSGQSTEVGEETLASEQDGQGSQGGGRQGKASNVQSTGVSGETLVSEQGRQGGQGGGRQGWAGNGQSEQSLVQSNQAVIELGELDTAEEEGLLYMREEEKLARDVYLAMYETWELPAFQNIAASEQAHMDALLNQLSIYGLDDPAAGTAQGEFTNPELQALYNQLVEQGNQSLADALKVGAAIEEIDILDLDEAIVQTNEVGIQAVYESLRHGSENHLRSFTSTLQQQTGETYIPQYMSEETYQGIVSGGNGNGGNSRGRRGGRS